MTTDTPQSILIPTLDVVDAPAFLSICFTTRATLRLIPQLGHVPPKLYADAARLGLTIAGPVQYSYEGATGDVTKEFTLTIALPIREQEAGALSEGITCETVPALRCTRYTYTGAWDTLMTMYDALFPAFYQQGYTYTGQLREVYTVVDLEQPDRCVMEIQIGCAQ